MFERYVSAGIVGGFAGFCVGVAKNLAGGNTMLDFVAATPDTWRSGVLSVDLAFLGMMFALVVLAAYDSREWAATGDDSGQDEQERESWVEVSQGNRTTRLYGVDVDAVTLISQGLSRRRCVKMGVSESRFNRATSELKKRGVVGAFSVL